MRIAIFVSSSGGYVNAGVHTEHLVIHRAEINFGKEIALAVSFSFAPGLKNSRLVGLHRLIERPQACGLIRIKNT